MGYLFLQNTKQKIIIAFILLFIVMCGIQYFSSVSINDFLSFEKDYHKNILALSKVESVKASALAVQVEMEGYFDVEDRDNVMKAKTLIESLHTESLWLRDNLKDSSQIEIANDLIDSVDGVLSFHQKLISLAADSGLSAEKRFADNYNVDMKVSAIVNLCEKIKNNQSKLLSYKLTANESFAHKVSQMDLIGTLFTLLILIFFGWILISDINKRNQLENDLKIAMLKATQNVRIKEQFMANMSHEIRTPMTAIIGFINLLDKTSLTDKQKDYLKTIKSSSENLLTIINDILDFSKIEAGMIRFEESPFSVQGLLHSINTMFLAKAKEKNIRLIFHPIENIPETLIGDPVRLTQVMINLIGNAVKFTHGGAVEVSVKLIKEDDKIATIQFTVSDTGIGIPKNKIGIIFERFQQADTETNRRFGGTGLGLSIVKDLVELQGGIISVDSEEGKGSVFSITIPYKKTSDMVKQKIFTEERIVQKDIVKNVRILIAEDNPLNRKLIHELFVEWGITFEFAENGKIAIEKLRTGNFGLVLMDIQMPEINGFEATRLIREDLQLDIPVIAMTAHALSGEREKCIASGMNDYISKPIKENELYTLIVKYVSSSSKEERSKFSSPEINNGPVTNLDFLTDLTKGNQTFFNEMIRIFLEECPKEILRLKEAIDKKDFQMIHANAHAMKSTIPFVGLDSKLNPLLEEMEESSDLNKIAQFFSIVEKVCDSAIVELKNRKV